MKGPHGGYGKIKGVDVDTTLVSLRRVRCASDEPTAEEEAAAILLSPRRTLREAGVADGSSLLATVAGACYDLRVALLPAHVQLVRVSAAQLIRAFKGEGLACLQDSRARRAGPRAAVVALRVLELPASSLLVALLSWRRRGRRARHGCSARAVCPRGAPYTRGPLARRCRAPRRGLLLLRHRDVAKCCPSPTPPLSASVRAGGCGAADRG